MTGASDTPTELHRTGLLALAVGQYLPLQVCKSGAGFYLGTLTTEGEPFTRESAEHWREKIDAERALQGAKWTQRTHL